MKIVTASKDSSKQDLRYFQFQALGNSLSNIKKGQDNFASRKNKSAIAKIGLRVRNLRKMKKSGHSSNVSETLV